MTDVVDLAQEREAANLADAMRLHSERAKLEHRPRAVGHCLNTDCCEDFTDHTRLFCGPACAERYASFQRLKQNRN
ncbi:TPA: hypothetical protein ACOECQ_000786 [Stenotrophomonas maltophilia]